MNKLQSQSLLLSISAVALPLAAHASDLSQVLECRDAAALTASGVEVAGLARAAGMECRSDEHRRETTLNCTGGRASAFGQPVKEFNLVRGTDEAATLQIVFTGSPGRMVPLFERERAAAVEGQPLSRAEWGQREDGVAELRCNVAGRGAGLGSISGRLDFRGVEPMPAMRVCAAPVRMPQTPTCIDTGTGDGGYVIENLKPGDYYVTSFATENNPNRLFGIYSSRLADCPEGDSACVGRRLQPVTVYAGEVRTDIDPDTLLQHLPPPLRDTGMHGDRP